MKRKEIIIQSYERYSLYMIRALLVTATVLIVGLIMAMFLTIGSIIAYFAFFVFVVSAIQLVVLKLILLILKRK